jgi:putative flippase GtrA
MDREGVPAELRCRAVHCDEVAVTEISAAPRRLFARYVFGSIISWPIYAALIALLYGVLGVWYLPAAGVSWVFSYTLVYAVQKYGTFGRDRKILLEMLLYAEFVIALSGCVNFGLLHVFESCTALSRVLATAGAALVAAGTGFVMSRIVLEPKIFEWLMRKPTVRFVAAGALGVGINIAMLYVLTEVAGRCA